MTIEDRIRLIAREEIARVLGSTAADYSTATAECYPPGCDGCRRRARDRVRAVPEHRRIGTGRATVWTVSRDAYHAHHGRRAPVLRVVATSTDEDIASRALERSTTRATRGTR